MPRTMTKDELYAAPLTDPDAQLRAAVAMAARDEKQDREEIVALARKMYLARPGEDRAMEWAVWQLMANGVLKKTEDYYYLKCPETDEYLVHASAQLEELMRSRTLNLTSVAPLLPELNAPGLQKLSLLVGIDRQRRVDEARVRSVFYDECTGVDKSFAHLMKEEEKY